MVNTHNEANAGLTRFAECGGCAAKADPEFLRELREGLADAPLPGLIAGLDPADDAAVIKLDNQRALIASVDFFPPLVDSAEDYGRIAATNAISDIYAMGGRLLFALAISGFPRTLDSQTVRAVNRAAAEVVKDHQGAVLGGHSIYCSEPIFGLCVVGEAHPDKVWLKSGARDGDQLVLSKPLGTGVLISSRQPAWQQSATQAMLVSNRAAAAALANLAFAPRAVTDITGFGLVGHASEIAEQSKHGLKIDLAAVEALPGALEALSSGVRTSAAESNQSVDHEISEAALANGKLDLLYDPQTSGGLLASVAASDLPPLLAAGFHRIGSVDARIQGVRVE